MGYLMVYVCRPWQEVLALVLWAVAPVASFPKHVSA